MREGQNLSDDAAAVLTSPGAAVRAVLDDEEGRPIEGDEVRDLPQEVGVGVGAVPGIPEAPVDKTLGALEDHEAEPARVGIDREDPPGGRRRPRHR